MMLSDLDIKNMVHLVIDEFATHVPGEENSEFFHVEESVAPVLIEKAIRAVLAKASQQVQGEPVQAISSEPCGLLDVISASKAEFHYYGYMEPGTYCVYPGPKAPHSSDKPKAMPTPKQEPERSELIGYIDLPNKDYLRNGINATIKPTASCMRSRIPVYIGSAPAQAAAIPDNKDE